MKELEIKQKVREGYASRALAGTGEGSDCGCGCDSAADTSRGMGYSMEDIKAVPDGANLGLGCGNPIAVASLSEGQTVLDLGSGGGFDCFLAARKVGTDGRVIGVDMTPEMIHKARTNAASGDYANVEFRLGEIEHLPVADNSVDVIISNCVINLAPDKEKVFAEAFRVLKPGGRIMVSDIVLKEELPETIKKSVEAYVGCIAGASMQDDYLGGIKAVGFDKVEIINESKIDVSAACCGSPPLPTEGDGAAASINVTAVKP